MFIYYIIGAIVLTQIPYIGKYFRLYNTLIHEIGHVVASILTRGKVYHVKLNSDTSGEASTGTRGFFSRVIVSIAGYPFASLISFLLIVLIHQKQYEYILYGVIALVVISIVFWVRNWFGIFWLLLSGVVSYLLLVYGGATSIEVYIKAMVAVIFVESVSSTIELMYIVVKDKENSGDARNLRLSTGITEYFWGILFIAVASVPVIKSFPLWF